MKLTNKIAFITGAGTGIGAQAARLFAAEGACVIIAERNAETGIGVEEGIVKNGGKAVFIQCDVTDEASVRDAVARVNVDQGEIDFLQQCWRINATRWTVNNSFS